MSRYDYVKYDDHAAKLSADYKKRFEELEAALNLDLGPGKRSLATAMTKLEEAFMWVGKAIRDNQFDRDVATAIKESTK
jgi:hypothetical protein